MSAVCSPAGAGAAGETSFRDVQQLKEEQLCPLIITDECINCDVCEPECPNEAISQGAEIYEIDPNSTPSASALRHAAVCRGLPGGLHSQDTNNVESTDQLWVKYEQLTGNKRPA